MFRRSIVLWLALVVSAYLLFGTSWPFWASVVFLVFALLRRFDRFKW